MSKWADARGFGTQAAGERAGFTDLEMTCCACGTVFAWSAGEQLFFSEHNLSAPRRCKPCRKTRIAPLSERS